MRRLNRTSALLAALSLGLLAAPPALADGTVPTAIFVLGCGGVVVRLAVDVQH